MNLRPYQQTAIQKTLEAIKAGKSNKQVWVMATGTGKTVAFSKLASHMIDKTGKKVLILAHREELLDQARNKILQTDPDLNVSIEQADNYSDHVNGDVIVASVPTLGRAGSSRIKKFNPEDFGLIVVDEAHHASANSYVNVLKHFGVLKQEPPKDDSVCSRCDGIGTVLDEKRFAQECSLCNGTGIEKVEQDNQDHNWNKQCLLLGVTATPSRSDNKGINYIFDDVVFEYNIIQAINEKYLSPIRAIRVRTDTDISGVKKTAGDFNLGELEKAVNTEERNQLIVKTYKKETPGKQALVFAVNIKHAMDLVETFVIGGVNTSFVLGSTEKEVRNQRLKDFHDKRINVMVNVGVLTEGVDIPSVDTVFMARPTSSGILYSQMLGRGTRLYPGKESLMVIDFVDTTKKAKLQTVASLIGKPDAIDFQGRDILAIQSELEDLQEVAPLIDLENLDVTRIQELIEKAKYAIEEVDLLGSVRTPLPLSAYSQYEWQSYNEDQFRLGLGVNKETGMKLTFSITETITENFIVRKHVYDTMALEKKKPEIIEIGTYPDISTAVTEADKYIELNHNDTLNLISSNARWRKDKPTEKQIEWLTKFGVQKAVLDKMTKGDATRALSKFFASKKKPLGQQKLF